MCETTNLHVSRELGFRTIPVSSAIGMVLAHDITEIRKDEFKGRAFKKGHVVRPEDICHLQRLGKEHLFVLNISEEDMHEDDAAYALAGALMGEGVALKGEPKEGKIDIVAARSGLLRIDKDALFRFNLLGEVMCATLHDSTTVTKGRTVAGTRAIPLVVKRNLVKEAVSIARNAGGVIRVKELRKPRVGIVITGNEVYYGRIKDAFAPILKEKVAAFNGDVVGIYYTPDDKATIVDRLRKLLDDGADLLITTGGMSVDPDDVTRFAVKSLGAESLTYGSAVLPGAMFLVAYIRRKSGNGNGSSLCGEESIPLLGIPACGMYARTTIFDVVLPRVLAGERIGRQELAELGHGGLCMKCNECTYPKCAFGRG